MIVYSGEDLVVHHVEGETRDVIITFGPAAVTHLAETEIFCERPIRKSKVSAIGITTRHDHWYFSETDEGNVIHEVKKLIAKYRRVIILGYSMGAHAAIRFSRLFNAYSVLSLSPKWSLDRQECECIEDRYVEKNFISIMKGMGLRRPQTHGSIFVAYDPNDYIDNYHGEMVARHIDCTILKMFYCGHGTIGHLSGTRNFKSIFDALSCDNPSEIVAVASVIRRRHKFTFQNVIGKARRQHPTLCLDLIKKLFSINKTYYKDITNNYTTYLTIFYSSKNKIFKNKYDCINYYKSINLPESVICTEQNINDNLFYLVSYHGTILFFDIMKFSFCTGGIKDNKRSMIPVEINFNEDDIYLFITLNNTVMYIYIKDNSISYAEEPDTSLRFKLVNGNQHQLPNTFFFKKENRFYAVVSNNGYIIVDLDFNVGTKSRNILEFESFVPLAKMPIY